MFEEAFLAALDHLLGGANWAQNRLKPFAGRTARIEIPPLNFIFEINADGRVQQSFDPNLNDVTIRLPSDTPFLLAQGIDKVMSRATVDGNAEFATELSFIFRNLRWDAEQDISRWVGDIAAHRLVQSASHFSSWQKQAATNLAESLAEYFTQENPLLITSREFTSFRDSVTRLTADLTRLEARCASLKSLP